MNEPVETPTPRKHKTSKYVFLVVLVLLLASWPLCPRLRPWAERLTGITTAPVADHVIDQRLSSLENHIKNLDAKLDTLTASLDKAANMMAQAPAAEGDKQPVALNGVRQDISTLAATVTSLKEQVKASAEAATQTQQAAQQKMAIALSLAQLREAVLGGHAYMAELATMNDAARDNTKVMTELAKLSPMASAGILTPAQLADQFAALETPAYQAIQKSAAQSGWDKFLAEVQDIVSIRHLNDDGGPNSKLAAIEKSLRQGDIPAALDGIKALPPEASAVFEAWRGKAEARLAAEQALHNATTFLSTEVQP